MVRLYRTFCSYIVTGETWCAGCLCPSSGWFKHIESLLEPHQHRARKVRRVSTELARCEEFCHKSSGWFNCTEPSVSTSVQGKQVVQGAYALVCGGSGTVNLIDPSRTTSLQR